MTLVESLVRQLENPTLSANDRVLIQCRLAAEHEQRGNYIVARDILSDLWDGGVKRPRTENLAPLTAGELLLRVGILSGCLGSAEQNAELQTLAKDRISKSIGIFESINEPIKAAIARSDLAVCYWREGANEEARIILLEALQALDEANLEHRAVALVRLTLVEISSGRYHDALSILTANARMIEEVANDSLRGRFHGQFALVLKIIATTEPRSEYIDRAILEYTAAIYYFEQAGNVRYRAINENNLGSLLFRIGRVTEAHEHLNLARSLFATVRDKGRIAQVDETRARVFLSEGRLRSADRIIIHAVQTLEMGGERGLLAEALTTQGCIFSRLGDFTKSQATFRRAADLAEEAGAIEDAGRALISLIEEHSYRLSEYVLVETYLRAESLLRKTQDAETVGRLRRCGSELMSARLSNLRPERWRSRVDFWANFDLSKRVHQFEARYIRRALIEAKGSVTRAARLLGIQNHGTLSAMLDKVGGRHKELFHLRTPQTTRHKSLVSKVPRSPAK